MGVAIHFQGRKATEVWWQGKRVKEIWWQGKKIYALAPQYPQWVEGTEYSVGDRVIYEGVVYECIAPRPLLVFPLPPPSRPSEWKVIGPA